MAAENNQNNQAMIVAVMGSSGSGKSLFIKQQIKKLKPQKLFVFDPMGEYGGLCTLTSSMADVYRLSRKSSFKIAYQPKKDKITDQFTMLCEMAYEIGNCWLVVDELQKVTSSSSSPAAWSECTTTGRHKGMTVIGASQRPSRIDKDFFSNATFVRSGRMNYKGDRVAMADVLDVNDSVIMDLQPLEYISRNMNTGEKSTGKLTYK